MQPSSPRFRGTARRGDGEGLCTPAVEDAIDPRRRLPELPRKGLVDGHGQFSQRGKGDSRHRYRWPPYGRKRVEHHRTGQNWRHCTARPLSEVPLHGHVVRLHLFNPLSGCVRGACKASPRRCLRTLRADALGRSISVPPTWPGCASSW